MILFPPTSSPIFHFSLPICSCRHTVHISDSIQTADLSEMPIFILVPIDASVVKETLALYVSGFVGSTGTITSSSEFEQLCIKKIEQINRIG